MSLLLRRLLTVVVAASVITFSPIVTNAAADTTPPAWEVKPATGNGEARTSFTFSAQPGTVIRDELTEKTVALPEITLPPGTRETTSLRWAEHSRGGGAGLPATGRYDVEVEAISTPLRAG